jgi:hypothetical protein
MRLKTAIFQAKDLQLCGYSTKLMTWVSEVEHTQCSLSFFSAEGSCGGSKFPSARQTSAGFAM